MKLGYDNIISIVYKLIILSFVDVKKYYRNFFELVTLIFMAINKIFLKKNAWEHSLVRRASY